MVTIVDYGMGNLRSILNMVRKIGSSAQITSELETIEKAEKLILPGVGAFDHGMENIRKRGLEDVLNRKVLEEKTPVLGICLGMQLFTARSEEGVEPGLGWIEGETVRFGFEPKINGLRVPHMGWNVARPSIPHPLFEDLTEPRFYFVHAYHVVCHDPESVLAYTDYGYPFASAVHRENIWGTQFHPEKSHRFGLKLLSNFINCTSMAGQCSELV